MNTNPAETAHLDLGDLIAEVTGLEIDDRAREHLASCEHCRVEANRWNQVADGVRDLASQAPEAVEPPARPRRGGQRARAWHHAMMVASGAAAALVILVGVGSVAGVVHVHLGGSTPGSGPVLTAVNGCTGLELATGTLEQVNGSSLVIKTTSGQPVTVATTRSTFVDMTGTMLGDITDGASVSVFGPRSGNAIAAVSVMLGPGADASGTAAGLVTARGTVADASSTGFTVVTSAGARIPVTTSGDTAVSVRNAGLDQLQDGATIYAVGSAGPDGTLSARAVAGVSQLPPGMHVSAQPSGRARDCSPSVIAEALSSGG
jgi:predicted anti-sigma-YlaC factor YlaD